MERTFTIAAALLFSDSCPPKADVIRGVIAYFFLNKFQAFNAFQCVWSFIQLIFQPSTEFSRDIITWLSCQDIATLFLTKTLINIDKMFVRASCLLPPVKYGP